MSGRWIRDTKRLARYKADGFTCICGAQSRWDDMSARRDGWKTLESEGLPLLTLDHQTPRSQEGGNEWRNLVTLCHRCNSAMQDGGPEALATVLGRDVKEVRAYMKRARGKRSSGAIALANQATYVLELIERARCPWCEAACESCIRGAALGDLDRRQHVNWARGGSKPGCENLEESG